jgi:hypothetical protein
LEHEVYRSWFNAEASSLLWISADPGCGKSVMMRFLIDHNKNQDLIKETNTCYFFFKSDNKEQRNPAHALSAILHQIYTAQPILIKHAMRELNKKGKSIRTLGTLWKIFVDTIEDQQARSTLCFIDGLDEMDSRQLKEFVDLVSKYFTTLQQSRRKHSRPHLKFLIASRPENSIKTAFDLSPATTNNIGEEGELGSMTVEHPSTFIGEIFMTRLRGEDQTDAISQDIELVVRAAIQRLSQGGLPGQILKCLEKEIIKRADRTHLWTALTIKLIQERAEAGASRRELEAILQSRNIDNVYAGLLNGKGSPVQARKLLSIILAATRPLTLGELNVALAIKPDHDTFQNSLEARKPGFGTFEKLELDLRHPFENYLKSLCGHFLRVIRGKVYFVHETARQFLLREERRGPAKPIHKEPQKKILLAAAHPDGSNPKGDENQAYVFQHSFDLRLSHALLLELCCTYLYFLGKDGGKYPTGDVAWFLKYASRYMDLTLS